MNPMYNLDLHPDTIEKSIRGGLKTPKQVLFTSRPELIRVARLKENEADMLIKACAKTLTGEPQHTALELHNKNVPEKHQIARLSLGCPILDRALCGGILSQGLTEISGESACGKTQFCIQLCLTVQLPRTMGGLEGGAVFVCTEDPFPLTRLQQIVPSFLRKLPAQVVKGIGCPTDRIFIEEAFGQDELKSLLSTKLPVLLHRHQVKLIVIDSVAGVFRVEYAASQSRLRAEVLKSFGARLHELSNQFRVPVVCVNQVADVFNDDGSTMSVTSSNRKVIPAMGLAWSNLLTVRLMLSRHTHISSRTVTVDGDDAASPRAAKKLAVQEVHRQLHVIFAPHLPNSVCRFTVGAEGVKGIHIDETGV